MSFVYDKEQVEKLRKAKEIGYLQPCIVDADTNAVLVGRHRKFADPKWPEVKVHVKDDLQREMIILCGNLHRIVSSEETRMRLTRIANILMNRGVPPRKVCAEMAKLPGMPYSQRWIEKMLPKQFKAKTAPKKKNQPRKVELIRHSQVNRIKTALDTSSGEPTYPFPDCRCKTCPHRNECY